MIDDATKAFWRRQFTTILHPKSPMLATLIEAADKVSVAKGFIEPLSQTVADERQQGLFVAAQAIRYGLKTLEFFGLIDGDSPPMPINLAQANQVLTNLVAVIHENIKHGQFAVGGSGEDAEYSHGATEGNGIGDASRRHASTDAGAAKRPKRSETPDKYEADLRVKKFIDSNPNATVKQVVAETGISAGRISKLESWRRLMVQRKADRHSPKKSERQLTDKMLAVRGANNDPVEKLMEDEAIWSWLLEVSPQNKKADLFSLDDDQKTNLIDLSRQKYKKANPQPDE